MTLKPGESPQGEITRRDDTERRLKRLDRMSPVLVIAGLLLAGAMAFYFVNLRFKSPQRLDGVLTEQEALYLVQSEALLGVTWDEARPMLEAAAAADPERAGEYTVPVEAKAPAVVRVLVEGDIVTAARYELSPPG